MKVNYCVWRRKGYKTELYYQDFIDRERTVNCDAKDFPRIGDKYFAIIEELREKEKYTENFTIHDILFDSETGIYRVDLVFER